MFQFVNKLALVILCIIGFIEFGLALWTILEDRYKSLAYNLADVGYIDLWILRYVSMCLLASSIITLVMCLILIWGLYSAHVFIFISTTMVALVLIAELIISMITLASKFQTRLTLQEQLPKLVITYRQGNDERASRALDILQSSFQCCGSDGRLSFQNNVPLSCNMFSIGCLTRTMMFLDDCMDALAYVLLFFSLLKLFIVIYFYSFLCIHQRHQRKHLDNSRQSINDPSQWRHSSSFDSSSSENLPKKIPFSSPAMTNHHDNDFVEKRRVILNDYDSHLPDKRVQNAAPILSLPILHSTAALSTPSFEQQALRKLSSISEKTERTETDDSEPDILRIRQYNSKRKMIITAVNQNQQPPPLPKKLPTIKNRHKPIGDDEIDQDSGVEHSSSEKSFDEQNSSKRRSDTPTSVDTNSKSTASIKKSTVKPPPTLSFSNVFVTSVSQGDTPEKSHDVPVKKPLTASPSTSSSFSDQLLLSDVTTPKPILKKSNQQTSPSSDQDRIPPSYDDQKKFSSVINTKPCVKLNELQTNNSTKIYVPYKSKANPPPAHKVPKPAPRPSLKQSPTDKHHESLV
ncbi:unnamed protein product [Adineta ricciae]|uniref:Tetraspanin n=1 Tax=Adineta ricciae TaxID=249248 RepID=A0A814XZR7_ADIRI|nr:unnamed protein product [Adineta ricciae]